MFIKKNMVSHSFADGRSMMIFLQFQIVKNIFSITIATTHNDIVFLKKLFKFFCYRKKKFDLKLVITQIPLIFKNIEGF